MGKLRGHMHYVNKASVKRVQLLYKKRQDEVLVKQYAQLTPGRIRWNVRTQNAACGSSLGGELIEHIDYIVFGNDGRQSALAETIRADGYQTLLWPQDCDLYNRRYDLGDEKDAVRVALLPMPLFDEAQHLRIDGLNEAGLLRILEPSNLVIGGRIPAQFCDCAKARGIRIVDYLQREDFAISNALTTAEAAIEIAMQSRKTILSGAEALVIGFGRIGRLLAHRLSGLGVRVTVSARKAEDYAWIRAYGYGCADTRALEGLERFEMVFNTVPAPVFGQAQLEQTREGVLLIDLASVPGGIDRYYATLLGRRVIWALSLPGKYAPYTAARCTADSIYAIVKEECYG